MRKSGFELNTLTAIFQAIDPLRFPREKMAALQLHRPDTFYWKGRVIARYLKKFSIGGDYKRFPLEHRIFNAFSFFSLIACILSALSSWLIELPALVIVLNLVCLCVFSFFFYISRFQGRYHLLVAPYIVLTCLLLSVLWFYNGGINGSITYFYLSALFSLLIIARKKTVTTLFIITNVLVLIFLEYHFPWLTISYLTRESHYWDISFSFIWVAVVTAFGVSQLIKNYEKEKMAQVRQMKELEKLAQVHNRLFSIISHDLRAPLRSVQATLQLQRDGHLSGPETQMLTEALARQVNNTNALLDNLFFWSRNQMQGIRALPIKTDLVGIIQENLELMAPLADRKQIRLSATTAESVMVYADPDMIKLIVRNLLSNAIKFSAQDDSVTITVVNGPQWVTVAVIDTGTGIDKDQINQLFQMNGHSQPGTANEKGSGLGLYLCREFVEENGGAIRVESEPGKGTAFYFTLPAAVE